MAILILYGTKSLTNYKIKINFQCEPVASVGQSATKPKLFSYNVVFEPGATQNDVLEYSGIKRLIEMAIEGFSTTCFCYGQTGSGKTHTLTGPPSLVRLFFKGSSINYSLLDELLIVLHSRPLKVVFTYYSYSIFSITKNQIHSIQTMD